VHRDLAFILADWSRYFKRVGSEAFSLLILLEGLRSRSRLPARFRYAELAGSMGVSPVTLRRWLRILKKAGLVHTEFVPHTNHTEAFFEVRLAEGGRSTSGRLPGRRRIQADQ
jgi:DNA-binding transcriptional ArsR family regulator